MSACIWTRKTPPSSWRFAPNARNCTIMAARKPEAAPTRIVTCPACKGESVYAPSNPYRPFCSERCKHMDLGAWASESFRVPTEAPPEDAIFGDPKLQ